MTPDCVTREEEPWEWDGDCTRCHEMLAWEGDQPASPEEALCDECAWATLVETRGENALLRSRLAALRSHLACIVVGAPTYTSKGTKLHAPDLRAKYALEEDDKHEQR